MSHIDSLPPLREVIVNHGLYAKRSFGQNFLLDLNVTMKIARLAGDLDGVTVLEIGPGPGGLTRALLASGAHKVVAIERDERCIPVLDEISKAYPQQLHVISGDARALDHKSILEQGGVDLTHDTVRIVANLPYNVATPLFISWIGQEPWPPYWNAMVLMFQKEVAQRIVAHPHDKAWGRLGVLASWRTQSEIAFDLPPQAFSPQPKVTSSVVAIQPIKQPLSADRHDLEKVTRAAFGQRRKMLRQSLKSYGGAELLHRAGIDGTRRAEELSLEEFIRLANELQ